MVRDPLYRQIEQRLGERLDPHLFERCAVELLREVYPGLVPVTGGDDGGMDGAIPTRTATLSPLIATTAAKGQSSRKRDPQPGVLSARRGVGHGGGRGDFTGADTAETAEP